MKGERYHVGKPVLKWVCLVLVCVTYLMPFAHRMSVVSFYDDIMAKYNVGYAQAGGLLTIFFLAICIMSLLIRCVLALALGEGKAHRRAPAASSPL